MLKASTVFVFFQNTMLIVEVKLILHFTMNWVIERFKENKWMKKDIHSLHSNEWNKPSKIGRCFEERKNLTFYLFNNFAVFISNRIFDGVEWFNLHFVKYKLLLLKDPNFIHDAWNCIKIASFSLIHFFLLHFVLLILRLAKVLKVNNNKKTNNNTKV